MPSKYMVSVVLGLSFNQIPIQKKRGLKKVSKFDIALPIVYMTHIQTNSVTKNLNLSLMKIESLKVTVIGMNHHTSRKGCPLSIVVPNLQILLKTFLMNQTTIGFFGKETVRHQKFR